jgi:hypothetical protein
MNGYHRCQMNKLKYLVHGSIVTAAGQLHNYICHANTCMKTRVNIGIQQSISENDWFQSGANKTAI